MNSLDILLIILLMWGSYGGFKKGFIAELVSSLLLVFGLIKGVALFHILLPIVERKMPTLATSLPISICLVILMISVGGGIIYLLTRIIRGILSITFLGIFDNVLGALFGLCKSAFLISLLIYVWDCVAPLSSAYIDNSVLWPLVEPIVPKILQSKIPIHL
ncbi:CvpA family protein [Candidatus Cardinium hertigii]|jgi:membrane protein required for colicin V production|uniref:CvpA family protein n=1 Tax=Candidatus Cardinium hertigii TaxID=247481 RepID=A0A3N2QCW6_9BACT|nr:CvpA family protein [Candidatus Cardinium hertigii]ROT47617.1 CvpA family protein [Candidatus Cardinium hertigii]